MILICDPVDETAVKKMRDAGLEVTVKTGLPKEELIKEIPPYKAMVVRSATKVTEDVIDAAANLKVIVRGGVGVDNIKVGYAKEKGIAVENTPAASSDSVAELAVAMMFGLSRFIAQSTVSMKSGKWEKKKFTGVELAGKTLGIIGIGRIGKAVARRAIGLGMNVIAYDPYIDSVTVGDTTIKTERKDHVIEKADIITLHVPFDPDKGAMLGKSEFDRMKAGVKIINCARGGVVDESALVDALKSGKVSGAGVDVFETEPPDPNHPLFAFENVILSPHVGASTNEAQERVGSEVADILIEYFAKK